jgi:IclR family pca regulon transcriptional regulator
MVQKKIKMAQAGLNSTLTVNSVQKAFRVLTAFSGAEPQLTLTQIAEKLDIDKSTAQRFTHTLLAMGYLRKDPVTKTLEVTVKVLGLAHIYLSSNPLIAAAMPYLIHLNGETGETANLTVLDGADVVFVSRIVGGHLLSTGVLIGTRLPAYASATGLAIMSVLDDKEVKKLLQISDLKRLAPKTVYEPEKILERLKIIRSKGYVLSVGDYFPNDISLGAPIVSRTGRVLGAMSLSVSMDRFTAKEAETKFAKLVSSAAKSVLI